MAWCMKHIVDIGMTDGGGKIKEGQLAQVSANLCTCVKHTYIGMVQDKLQIICEPTALGHLGMERFTQQCKDGSSSGGHPKKERWAQL